MPTPTPTPSAPHISAIPSIIVVGSSFDIAGANFTKGSVVNFFVSTSNGPLKAGTFTPSHQTAALLTVDVPVSTPLGQGFASVEVINTDRGFTVSNTASALRQGLASAGIPTITTINGVGLAKTSSDPNFATNNVETVMVQGKVVEIGGAGFDTANGVAIDLFCACPKRIGPFFLNPGNPGLTSTLLTLPVPASGPNSPRTGPGAFVVSNAGATKSFEGRSNAASVPIGARISVSSVIQTGSTITVTGTGFASLSTGGPTVINFFNTQPGGKVVNLCGLKAGNAVCTGFSTDTQLQFSVPSGAAPGPSYIQALNPPFVPFTSSGSDPGGSFTLK